MDFETPASKLQASVARPVETVQTFWDDQRKSPDVDLTLRSWTSKQGTPHELLKGTEALDRTLLGARPFIVSRTE